MFTAECMDNMPRCVIRLAAYTYEGLLKNILPGIISGWETRYGYKEGVHFWIGKEPPEELNIPKPYRAPRGKPQHNMYWYNGSVMMLSSLTGTINNGTEYDALLVEEGKFADQVRLTELILAKRGNISKFGKSPYYGAVLIVTDRPRNQMGRYLLDYKDQQTTDISQAILKAWKRIGILEKKLEKQVKEGHKAAAAKTQKLIRKYEIGIEDLRKNCVLFSEASTLDNIHALGVSTIRSFIELLDKHDYDLSVLNLDNSKVINGFYASHGPQHIHDGTNFSKYDESDLNNTKNCLADLDCDLDSPIHIAFDVNAAINNVVIGQPKGDTIYCTNHMWVEQPQYLKDLCLNIAKYYRPHHTKRIIFHYNQTLTGQNAQGNIPDYELIMNTLTEAGYSVQPNYLGGAIQHHILYGEWQKTFHGQEGYLKWSSNAVNCHYLRISMDNADLKIVRGKESKDKSSERKDYKTGRYKVPPLEATHASEAADMLMQGMQKYRSSSAEYISDVVVMD